MTSSCDFSDQQNIPRFTRKQTCRKGCPIVGICFQPQKTGRRARFARAFAPVSLAAPATVIGAFRLFLMRLILRVHNGNVAFLCFGCLSTGGFATVLQPLPTTHQPLRVGSAQRVFVFLFFHGLQAAFIMPVVRQTSLPAVLSKGAGSPTLNHRCFFFYWCDVTMTRKLLLPGLISALDQDFSPRSRRIFSAVACVGCEKPLEERGG